MIRLIALASALALAQPAFAQPAPPPVAPAAPAGKPAVKKPPATRPSAPAKTAGAAKPAAAAASGPCIGVIPVIGESFVVQRIGIMVFGNTYKPFPIDSWGLDDLAVARVRAAAGPGYTVRRLAFSRSDFDSLKRPALFWNRGADLAGIVRKIAGSAGCQRYVVIEKSRAAFSSTNQSVDGIGVVNYGFSGLDNTFLFALTYVWVYDGKSFEVLKKRAGVQLDEGATPIFGPSRPLENFAWPDDPGKVITPAMRDATRGLLARSLDETLPVLLAP